MRLGSTAKVLVECKLKYYRSQNVRLHMLKLIIMRLSSQGQDLGVCCQIIIIIMHGKVSHCMTGAKSSRSWKLQLVEPPLRSHLWDPAHSAVDTVSNVSSHLERIASMATVCMSEAHLGSPTGD